MVAPPPLPLPRCGLVATSSGWSQRRVSLSQCAVRAATQGRVLVLEGLEKAERNVLPVLNNLLENREMQLEDGRFLMSAERYDKLLQVRGHLPPQLMLNSTENLYFELEKYI